MTVTPDPFEGLNNPDYPVPDELKSNVAITTLDRVYNWARAKSVWPMLFGLACCAIEMMATGTPDYDIARFGMVIPVLVAQLVFGSDAWVYYVAPLAASVVRSANATS